MIGLCEYEKIVGLRARSFFRCVPLIQANINIGMNAKEEKTTNKTVKTAQTPARPRKEEAAQGVSGKRDRARRKTGEKPRHEQACRPVRGRAVHPKRWKEGEKLEEAFREEGGGLAKP